MSTNPYAPPVGVDAPVANPTQQVQSVIRVFRMLGWLTCLVVLIALVGLIGDGPSYVEAAVFSVYLLPLASGVFYLRTASRMARGDQQIDNRTKWLAILIVVGFPLFPFALSCFPVFVAVGLMCRHALKHHYQAYCEVLNPPMSGTPEG